MPDLPRARSEIPKGLLALSNFAQGMPGPACICSLLVLIFPLALATVMELAKYFHKETDKNTQLLNQGDQAQEKERSDVMSTTK